jgi:iron only hydrogenase large subunit-like protein
LKLFGFDDVFEVAAAAEMISEKTRELLKTEKQRAVSLNGHIANLPLISSACPSVVRLIRVRFPDLIPNISPLVSPMELAAHIAVTAAIKKTGLPRSDIGVFFITPCPAKVTAVYAPIGRTDTDIDGVIAIKDMYPLLLPHLKTAAQNYTDDLYDTTDLSYNPSAGRIGVSWGREGGESAGILIDKYLSADGIGNVIKVLEELEDDKLHNIDFIELNACPGGCVGGVLAVENPHIAKVKMNVLRKYLPISGAHLMGFEPPDMFITEEIDYIPAFNLGGTVSENMSIMKKALAIRAKLPGLDCGCCGAPSCRAHSEDIARGMGTEKQCIHILKDYLQDFVNEIKKI